ncbi:hypothetical protein J0B02_16475 [Enterobacteriaceae bacterium YMB-R22]|uniref:hypothetical protein n=1 Tax=Tenebrionicola larvae TaxID=2815733 RepID=UPI002011D0B2|nr:hypothetical protein [Tenebrionicola larvae]MBV4414391.1 hypothetical protein [Tenebrionicola larvae]
MKSYKKIIIATVFAWGILPVSLIFLSKLAYSPTISPQSCQAQMSIIHKDFLMDSKYAFSFMDGRGDVFIIGIIVNNGVKYIINRQITFTYQKKTKPLFNEKYTSGFF